MIRQAAQPASVKPRRSRREDVPCPPPQGARGLIWRREQGPGAAAQVKDSVKGVVITVVDGTSDADDKRISLPATVIVRWRRRRFGSDRRQQEGVEAVEEGRQEIRALLVANGDGELRVCGDEAI